MHAHVQKINIEWKFSVPMQDVTVREIDSCCELLHTRQYTVNDFTLIIFANQGHVPNRGQLSASTSNSGSDPN